MDTQEQRNLRHLRDRRLDQRRQEVPESLKPFLGWVVPEERRENERRREARRAC